MSIFAETIKLVYMKKTILLGAMALSSAFAMMAEQKMYVHQSDGTTSSFYVNNVDSITFKEIVASDAMPSDAKTLAAKIYTGINIGNTLESTDNDGGWCPDGETCWGAAKVTPALIKAYKAAGFNAVRVPVAWHAQESNTSTYEIKSSWMARVKEVVDYIIAEDMYAIVNIHWDNGWLEKNCTTDKQEAVNKEQEALWKQIATTFKDYDEHLLFASANEPDVSDATGAAVLKSYHQTFVNTVRATGGNNAYRNLIIQGAGTEIDRINLDVIPTDVVEDRMMFEVHFYPYTYALMEEDADWGTCHYFWGEKYANISVNGVVRSVTGSSNPWCDESYVDKQFASLKTNIVDKLGMPVIMGEYAIMDRDLSAYNLQDTYEESRAYYYEYVNREMKNNGIVPFLWDCTGNLFNRYNDSSNGANDNSIAHPKALEGIMTGAASGQYPF